jgi:hypothetical protein
LESLGIDMEGSIKIDLKEIGSDRVDLIHIAYDSGRCLELVKAAMYLRVS